MWTQPLGADQVKRCMFTIGPRTKKGLHPVFWARQIIKVGYLCERNGKGAGWSFRICGTDVWSESYSSKKQAVLEMGKKL